jgi:hypothetical protein
MLKWKFGADTSPYRRGLNEMKAQTKALSGSLKGMIAGAIGFAAIKSGFQAVFREMDRVHKLGQRFGESAETIQKIDQAAELAGASIETVAKAMQAATRNALEAANGTKSYADTFDQLGINAEEFVNLPMDQKLLAMAKALDGVSGDGEKVALSLEAMGRGGAELLPLLRQNSEELAKLFEEAPAASDRAVEAIAKINDAWTRTTNVIKVEMAELVPYLKTAWDAVMMVFVTRFEVIKSIFTGISDLAVNTGSVIKSALTLDLDGAKKAFADYKTIATQTAEDVANAFKKNSSHFIEEFKKDREEPGGTTGGGSTGLDVFDPDSGNEAKKAADERKRLLAEIAQKEEAAVMRQVDLETQLVLLMEKRKSLLSDMSGTENDQLARRSQALDIERQIEATREKIKAADLEAETTKAERQKAQDMEIQEHNESLIAEKQAELESIDTGPRLKVSDLAAVGGGGFAALSDTTAAQQRHDELKSEIGVIIELMRGMPSTEGDTIDPTT